MNSLLARRARATVVFVIASLTLTACVIPVSIDRGPMMQGDGEQNAADIMFVQMMIPHHEQAVEMSEIILAKDDVDTEVVALAQQIQAAQEPEIALMEQWLDDWGVPSMGGMGGMNHGGMDGMASEAQMAELKSASGASGSALFLTLMIEHHEGALTMADNVIDNGRSQPVRDLAVQIRASQLVEIDTMKSLLAR